MPAVHRNYAQNEEGSPLELEDTWKCHTRTQIVLCLGGCSGASYLWPYGWLNTQVVSKLGHYFNPQTFRDTDLERTVGKNY